MSDRVIVVNANEDECQEIGEEEQDREPTNLWPKNGQVERHDDAEEK